MEPTVGSPKSTEDKDQGEILSPLKPQQLHFGSTLDTSQRETNQKPLLPLQSTLPPLQTPVVSQPLIPLPLPPPVLPTMMANIPGAPRIHNIVHIPYFLGRQGSDPNTHIAKFEINVPG